MLGCRRTQGGTDTWSSDRDDQGGLASGPLQRDAACRRAAAPDRAGFKAEGEAPGRASLASRQEPPTSTTSPKLTATQGHRERRARSDLVVP
jgi:hypothetical protein